MGCVVRVLYSIEGRGKGVVRCDGRGEGVIPTYCDTVHCDGESGSSVGIAVGEGGQWE